MSDVILSVHPWVGGTRIRGFWGPIHLERKVAGISWEEAIDGILDQAAQEARDRSCNAVVAIEIYCDPYRYHDGGHVTLLGTISDLEPLFAGVEVAP